MGSRYTQSFKIQAVEKALSRTDSTNLALYTLLIESHDPASNHNRRRNAKGCYSGNSTPEPPAASGKSLNLGRPSRIGCTVSW